MAYELWSDEGPQMWGGPEILAIAERVGKGAEVRVIELSDPRARALAQMAEEVSCGR